MTSEEAIQAAKDSLSNEDLKRFRLTRGQWEEQVDWLAGAYHIYPNGDPRNNEQFSDSQ